MLDICPEQITQETQSLMLQQITGQALSQAAQSQVSAQEQAQQSAATIEPKLIVSTNSEDSIHNETNCEVTSDSETESIDRYFRLFHSFHQLNQS